MSVRRPQKIGCRCGWETEVLLFGSVNAVNHPHLRQAILDRTLHTFECGGCGVTVEAPINDFDIDRRQFISCFSGADRRE